MGTYNPNELAKAKNFNLVIDQVIEKISDEVIKEIKMGENVLTNSPNTHFTLGMNIRNSILMQQEVKDQIPFYSDMYYDSYSGCLIELAERKLQGKILFSEWILSNCNWIEATSFSISNLENLSIRARSMAAIYAIEQLCKSSQLDMDDTDYLIETLTKHLECEKNGNWHYPYSEIVPNSILPVSYNKVNFKIISEVEYSTLKKIYLKTEEDILNSINDLLEISTADLYSSIVNKSQYTLNKLINVFTRLAKNQIRIPHFTINERMNIDYANGWGENISYKEFKESFKD